MLNTINEFLNSSNNLSTGIDPQFPDAKVYLMALHSHTISELPDETLTAQFIIGPSRILETSLRKASHNNQEAELNRLYSILTEKQNDLVDYLDGKLKSFTEQFPYEDYTSPFYLWKSRNFTITVTLSDHFTIINYIETID